MRPPTDALMAAVSFIGFLSRAEAIAALEHRTAQIHSMVRGIEFGIEAHDGVDSPFHVREMMRLLNARVLAEVEWARQFIARLKLGEYVTADDPEWRPASELARAAAARATAPAGRGNRRSATPRNGAPRSGRADRSPANRDRGEPVKRGRDGRGEAMKRGRHRDDRSESPGRGIDRPRRGARRDRAR